MNDSTTTAQSSGTKWRVPRVRFRLTTLLILVTLLGFILAPIANELRYRQRQIRVAYQLDALGGQTRMTQFEPSGIVASWLHLVVGEDDFLDIHLVAFHERLESEQHLGLLKHCPRLSAVYVDGSPVGTDGVRILASLRQVSSLNLSHTQVADPDLAVLARMPNLRNLGLDGCAITDVGLDHLSAAPRLVTLSIAGTDWSPEGVLRLRRAMPSLDVQLAEGFSPGARLPSIEQLSSMRELKIEGEVITDTILPVLADANHLRALRLKNTSVTDAGLTHVAALKKLERLMVTRADFSSVGTAKLSELRNLRELSLADCGIDDEAVEHLAHLPRLEYLNIRDSAITDAALEMLARLPALRGLDVSGTAVTDEGLATLAAESRLRLLSARRTNLSEPAIVAFREKRPNCTVFRPDDPLPELPNLGMETHQAATPASFPAHPNVGGRGF